MSAAVCDCVPIPAYPNPQPVPPAAEHVVRGDFHGGDYAGDDSLAPSAAEQVESYIDLRKRMGRAETVISEMSEAVRKCFGDRTMPFAEFQAIACKWRDSVPDRIGLPAATPREDGGAGEKLLTRDEVEVRPGDDLYRITTVGDGEEFAQGVNEWRGNVPYFSERQGEPDTPEQVQRCYSTRAIAASAIEGRRLIRRA